MKAIVDQEGFFKSDFKKTLRCVQLVALSHAGSPGRVAIVRVALPGMACTIQWHSAYVVPREHPHAHGKFWPLEPCPIYFSSTLLDTHQHPAEVFLSTTNQVSLAT